MDELESRLTRKLATHHQAIAGILDAIRELMAPPAPPRRRVSGSFRTTEYSANDNARREGRA